MPDPAYFESLMLIFFSLNWYWSIARMIGTRPSAGKSVSANALIALGYCAAIMANWIRGEAAEALPAVFWICCWNFLLTLADLSLIMRFRARCGDVTVAG